MTGPALHPSERAALRTTRPRTVPWRPLAGLAIGVAALLGLSAHALAGREAAVSRPPAARPFLPASAPLELPLEQALASPAAGTTGTIDLPPEPVRAAFAPEPAGITAARPFAFGRAGALDRGRALECLTAAIYYEAASEPDDGQRAVAQVVLNRARHPAFPASVCGVVYQGSERASGCQFSYACDGSMARVPSRTGWARAARVAAAALHGYVFAPVGLATHYHTYAVTPAWNRTLVMTDAIGAHFFHRWKGYWGTAAAFHQVYAGREPVPGPHPKLVPALPAAPPVTPLVVAAVAPVPVTPPSQVQPAHREAGEPVDNLPQSTVLDRWKDAGKPLR